jgi:hypothetical protein
MHDATDTSNDPNLRVPYLTSHQSPQPSRITPECSSITPDMLTLIELDQSQIDGIIETVPGGAANVQDIYPLAPLQEGILFHHLLNEQNDSYILSTLFELPSRADVSALVNSIQIVINRHDILRSAILWKGLPRPVHVVHREAILPVKEIALDPNLDHMQQLKEQLRPRAIALDLSRAPVGQLELAYPQGGKCFALLRLHHIICDHESLRLLVSEVSMCLEGGAHRLTPPIAHRNSRSISRTYTEMRHRLLRHVTS